MGYLLDHKLEFMPLGMKSKTTIMGNDKNVTYKEFYSLDEALIVVRTSVEPHYFISTLLKGKNTIII